jgi:serine/threonine protein phosphatase PrpC
MFNRLRDLTPNSIANKINNNNNNNINLKNKTIGVLHERKKSFDSKKGIPFFESINDNNNFNLKSNSFKNLNYAKENQKPSSREKSGKSNNNNNNNNNKTKQNFHNINPININQNLNKNLNQINYIKKFSGKTRAGRTYDRKPKTNQDSFLIKTQIFDLENFNIFGVFDGHGSHGHFISNMIKLFFSEYYLKSDIFLGKNYNNNNRVINNNGNFNSNLISIRLSNILNNSNSTNNIGNNNNNYDGNLNTNINLNINENLIYEKLKEKNYHIIKNSFQLCESSISLSKYDVNFSGSTCVICFFIDNKIICGNSGDSRAILITNEKGYDSVVFLSRDHKPNLADEMRRITRLNGRVDKYCENGIRSGPFRVWLKNQNYPGLAMSRSIGDLIAGSIGVINEPEIIEYELNEFSKFIVIASDGVWEFLSNEKVMEIINFYYITNFDANAAAEKLVEEATKLWRKVNILFYLLYFFNIFLIFF